MNNASYSFKAEEVLLQQPELIGDIATDVSKELRLKDINNTLGKDIIRFALHSNDFNIFKDECNDYGLKSNDFLYSIYKKVNDTKSSVIERVYLTTFLYSSRSKASKLKRIQTITRIIAILTCLEI